MDLARIQKAYFVGVGGIGVSALLRLFASRGIQVAGSDIHLPSKETLPPGEYFEGENADNVPRDAGVLIYSPAVPTTNTERVRARETCIPELSYPEALALVTRTYNTIAVSGTHGKSTTTALLGKLFEAGGFDPSVIVGAETPGWNRNLRVGGSDPSAGAARASIFIVEACEYRRNMMQLSPQTILLTNLELDHPDYYFDLADIKSAFHDYIQKLGDNGLLIMNNDDANIRDITRDFDGRIVRYGIGADADLVARNVKQSATEQAFTLVWKGTELGTFTTPLPGIYNIYNILGALATYLSYRGKTEVIQGALSNFHGVLRRFEVLGMQGGATIITDYAHHPTALRAVVTATLARYEGKKVLVVFRPHHRERTEKLFEQFVGALLQIPHTILLEIYDVAGREPSTTASQTEYGARSSRHEETEFSVVRGEEEKHVSSNDLVRAVRSKNPNADIVYAKGLDEGESLVRAKAGGFDAVLIIGAGDAHELAKRLVSQSSVTIH